MKPTEELQILGQSLWLDNITRGMLKNGDLKRYVDELSVTGLTSNPTIFVHAIQKSRDYDDAIARSAGTGQTLENQFFDLAIDDLRQAADLFRPVYERTGGEDGWASLELSPLLGADTAGSIAAAKNLYTKADRPNIFIKIPGTREGVPAIEEAIFAGVPINVTLLFSKDQYMASAEAYMRGIERRIAGGLDPVVHSVGSIFVSRWDVAANSMTPPELHNKLGVAVCKEVFKAYRDMLESERCQMLLSKGGKAQRLLWASTGTKDPKASDVLYIEALATPNTINTMPEETLKAFADHGHVRVSLSPDGSDYQAELDRFRAAGVDINALAERLQTEGMESFTKSWKELMETVESKGMALRK